MSVSGPVSVRRRFSSSVSISVPFYVLPFYAFPYSSELKDDSFDVEGMNASARSSATVGAISVSSSPAIRVPRNTRSGCQAHVCLAENISRINHDDVRRQGFAFG